MLFIPLVFEKKYFASKEELNNSDIESLNTQRAKVQNTPIRNYLSKFSEMQSQIDKQIEKAGKTTL